MKISRYISVIIMMFYLVSCGGKAAVVPTLVEFDAEKSFAKANKLIDDREYTEARAILLEIKNRDMSKKFAPLAQLRIADSYVKEDDTDLAVAEYRKFIEMFPDHRYASYAQYEIAMVYFNQIEGPERGYGGAAKALAEFEKLKRKFPRNPYKDVVDLRIEKCRNVIADYEFMVAEYYMKKGSFNASIERLEELIKSYPDYKKIERAFLDLGISYKKTGRDDKAEEYLKVLLEKYPNSPLIKDAKKELSSIKPVKK